MKTVFLLFVSVTAVALTGCSSSSSADINSNVTKSVSIDGSKYKLAEEPEGAVGVIAARESAEDGAPLVLVGRIGGSKNPWIDGRAAFTLLDASMNVVAEGDDCEEGEICTGDCCAKELQGCTTLVKVVDKDGQIVPMDTRELLGLKESDMVVVQGTAKKDKSGNLTMLADGVYVRQ